MSLNWYPGHMAKAKRKLQEQLSYADVVIEVCDARLPLSSRNPDLDSMTAHKQRILLLNKVDLADTSATKSWEGHFRKEGITVMSLNSIQMAARVFPLVERAVAEKVERARDRGFNKTVRAVVVGVPNVGKSTLINSMKGKASIKTADRPGVTRSVQWFRVTPYLEMMDSPGLLWPKLNDALAARRLAYIGSIKDEVHDTMHLSIQLLEELILTHTSMLMERYKIADNSLRGQALLEAICRSRGYLLRAGELDLERGAAAVLDEFRDGRIGRITLELPERTV